MNQLINFKIMIVKNIFVVAKFLRISRAILLALLLPASSFALSTYQDGKTLCKSIAAYEDGKWVDVPLYYGNQDQTTAIYFWFLGKKFNPALPTIAFINGGPGHTSHNYDSVFDQIQKMGFNILFFDQRGYVCSRFINKSLAEKHSSYHTTYSANDLEHIRKTLKIEKLIVYAQSFGTPIGLRYASQYPKSLSSLVVEGAANVIYENRNYDPVVFQSIAYIKEFIQAHIPLELEENYLDSVHSVASSFSHNGIKRLNLFIKKKLNNGSIISRCLFEEAVEKVYSEVSYKRGIYVFRDAKEFEWEAGQYTELIIEREFECDPITCMPGSEQEQNSFDLAKLNFSGDTKISFFHGRFDGFSIENVKKLSARIGEIASTQVISFPDRGHGPIVETWDAGSEDEKNQLMLNLKKAFLGQF